MEIEVANAVKSHGPALAEIHLKALPDDLLPQVGTEFLASGYYSVILRSDFFWTLIARKNQKILGFITVAPDRSLMKKGFLSSDPWIVCRVMLWQFFRQPVKTGTALVNLVWAGITNTPYKGRECEAEIAFIAVDPDFQGAGIGTKLIDEAMLRLEKAGIDSCVTKTLESNADVVGLYREKYGWRVLCEFWSVNRKYLLLGGKVRLSDSEDLPIGDSV